MIDPFHREGGGEHIPVPNIVGSYHAALGDAFSCEGNAIGFQAKRPGLWRDNLDESGASIRMRRGGRVIG
jgi:hypothetical protein